MVCALDGVGGVVGLMCLKWRCWEVEMSLGVGAESRTPGSDSHTVTGACTTVIASSQTYYSNEQV